MSKEQDELSRLKSERAETLRRYKAKEILHVEAVRELGRIDGEILKIGRRIKKRGR